jgi:two-component system chemotaxis response regulator CheB
MLVDDSSVVRGFVSQWVAAEPGFTVVGAAANGLQALSLLDVLRPDIVLLDLDMPELDGLSALPLLLARRPDLSVVVVSTLTRQNAEISLQCLARGAVDYLAKPETRRGLADAAAFRRELVHKLKGLAARHLRGQGGPRPAPVRAPGQRPPRAVSPVRPRVVAIGASTGGPQALGVLLRGLGEVGAAVPILIVQHMPEVFTTVFAEQLRAQTGLAVAEAVDGEPLRPGRVYLAPGGYHLGLAGAESGAVLRLDPGPPVHHCRPAVDVLFADVARVFGPAALAIVLTGMGSDGTAGAKALVEAGSHVIVQDEATSVVWGMPGSIAKAGLARQILPLEALAGAVKAAIGPSC